MAEGDLSLKAVMEAILDSKGFEEMKTKLEETAAKAKKAGEGADASGVHFEKLGRRLPNAAFDIMSKEMLRNIGVQEGLGPLTRVSTAGLEALAGAGQLTGTAMAGATLGLSLLIPLIALLATKGDEAADATVQVADDTDTLVTALENLQKKTGTLTQAQADYLVQLKEIQAEERKRAEDSLQKQIEAEEKATKATFGLWNATKLLVTGMIDHQIKGKDYVSLEDRMFAESEKHRKEAELLTAKLAALREAHVHGAKTAEEYANKLAAAAEKTREEGERAKDAAKKVAEFRIQLEARIAQEKAALNLENASTTAAREEAIAAQEKVLLDQQIASAKKAGATERELDDLRLISHTRVLTRIRAEEKKWATDREKMIADGLKKNEEEAKAIIANRQQIAEANRAEEQARLEARATDIEAAQAGIATIGTLFGKNKATMTAQAIIDTYAAANKALSSAPPPLSFALAALSIATGLKNVQQIQSANAGFDDPINDLLARDFGRKWAADFTREVGTGFARGLKEHSGNVTNNSTRIERGIRIENASFNGGGSPSQALLRLERSQIRVRRTEDRTRRRSQA